MEQYRWALLDAMIVLLRASRTRDTGPRTALPPPNEASSKELTAIFLGQTREGDRVILQERVEFRDKLKEIAERKKAPIQSPGWPGDFGRILRGSPQCGGIAFTAKENYPLAHRPLPRVGIGVDVFDCRIRNPILEAEAVLKGQRSRAPTKKRKIRTAHDHSPLPGGRLRQGGSLRECLHAALQYGRSSRFVLISRRPWHDCRQ